MPAAITRGMAAITCAKNEFSESRAGVKTEVAFTCMIVDTTVIVLISKSTI
jgi:hypothetical protein